MALLQVLETLQTEITAQLNLANIGTAFQVVLGSPLATELAKTQGQKTGVIVSLYPLKSRREVKYINSWYNATPPTVSLVATVSNNAITFSGAVTPSLNIHVFMGDGRQIQSDVYYQAALGDTLASVATAVAAALTAQGYTATASGAVVTPSVGFVKKVNIGGAGAISQEVNRQTRMVQVTIFAPTPELRANFSDALMTSLIGSTAQPFLTLPDGSAAFIRCIGEDWLEPAQISYTLYQACVTYELTYMLENVSSATQIESVQATQSIGNNAPSTHFTGG